MPKLDPRKAALVGARDLRDAVSDVRLAVAMAGLTLVVPLLSAGGIRALAYWSGGTGSLVQRLTVVGAFFVVFLPASYSLVLALESFVGERERATLEVLLSTPLKEAEIYAGKVGAVLLISLTLCYGGLGVYCLAVFPGLGYFPAGVVGSLALSTICQVAAMVAGAVIVSANARTMRAANVMASFIILPMSVVLQAEAALILVGRGDLLWGFAAIMATAAVVLLRMGLAGFSREALLARESGVRRGVRAVAWATAGELRSGLSPWRLVWARRTPVLLAAAGFPAGLVTGWLAGASRAVPAVIAKPALGALLKQASPAAGPLGEAAAIFTHNLLALLVVGLLAAVTAGLVAFVLTLAPGFLVGYAAAASSWAVALGGILPHGLLELPAAAIAGGLAVQIGASAIHMRPEGGWTGRIARAHADYARMLVALVPVLAAAALLETYVTA